MCLSNMHDAPAPSCLDRFVYGNLLRRIGLGGGFCPGFGCSGFARIVNELWCFFSSLAYCATFIVMSSDVVDLNICICMRASSYQSLIVPSTPKDAGRILFINIRSRAHKQFGDILRNFNNLRFQRKLWRHLTT